MTTPIERELAGFLAELGQLRMKAGKYDSPATLQPLYLRHPAITQPKREWRQNGNVFSSFQA